MALSDWHDHQQFAASLIATLGVLSSSCAYSEGARASSLQARKAAHVAIGGVTLDIPPGALARHATIKADSVKPPARPGLGSLADFGASLDLQLDPPSALAGAPACRLGRLQPRNSNREEAPSALVSMTLNICPWGRGRLDR